MDGKDSGGNFFSRDNKHTELELTEILWDKLEVNADKRENNFRNLAETIPAAIHVLQNDKFVFINSAFKTITGYSDEELNKINFIDLIHPDSIPTLKQNILKRRQGENDVLRYELKIITKQGKEIWMDHSTRPTMFNGQPAILAVLYDITELKQDKELLMQQNKALQVTQQELEDRNAEMERFIYTVSHDLRSPLITIKGFSGMILDDMHSGRLERVEKDINRIINAASKMENLLEDLLELSRIGRMLNSLSEFSMTKLCYDVAELLDGILRESRVNLIINEHMPTVKADEARIREVLQNLIENAVKFMGDQKDPQIEISYNLNRDEHIFFVKDNGQGIEPKYQEKIFGLFDKLDLAAEGTGIGLALVKRIIEYHKGRVWVESDGLGKGATFYFSIPISL